jgi:four helix bundle protein
MQKELIENNPILKLTLEFSLLMVEYCDVLQSLKKFTVANQLIRSGTAIGANSLEAQNAESRADFIHKLKIAAKEADETQYWLIVCEYAKDYPDPQVLVQKLVEVQKVLSSILGTAKRKASLNAV